MSEDYKTLADNKMHLLKIFEVSNLPWRDFVKEEIEMNVTNAVFAGFQTWLVKQSPLLRALLDNFDLATKYALYNAFLDACRFIEGEVIKSCKKEP